MKSKLRNLILFIMAACLVAAVGYATLKPGGSGVSVSSGHGDGHGDEHADEGSVELSDAKVAAANIELVQAGPQTLRDTLVLNGVLQPNQEALLQVTPRFPGVIKEIRKRVGEQVEKGELLARIESNQSLTSYEIKASISGTVIDRQASLGEYASEQKPLFTIADLSTVWVDFSVHRRDLRRVKMGDTVLIDVEDGGDPIESKLSYLSPVGSSDTQSALARASVTNDQLRLRPGLFVTGKVVLSARETPIAVKNSALQTIENRTVVFVRNGQKFEIRDVELGQRDQDYAEVVFGLLEGDVYAAKNSFVVKAEQAKGSASHDH